MFNLPRPIAGGGLLHVEGVHLSFEGGLKSVEL